ncbi:hypothetical protein HPB48_014679 [Haemaphysalis longicornis]|uniref:Nlr family card domain protein n=1 Tax=Haemaphysalis longicornis TaxID=44386 RepID=A0A9J6GAY4_HAELO|nr:hypothetical protein HPB48_014679 [Haemaphysalis longicornis]
MTHKHSTLDLAKLQGSSGFFTGSKLQFPELCTANQREACHIVAELPIWNEYLCQACIELREDAPGQLYLVFRDYYQFECNGENQMERAFVLVGCLLKMHHCLVGFHLRYSFFDIGRFQELLCFGSNVYHSLKSLIITGALAPLLLQNISMVIPQLRNLEELRMEHSKVSDGFIEAVCTLISTSAFLKQLCLPNYDMNKEEAEAVYNALKLNINLEELHVNTSFLLPETTHCCVDFACYLAHSNTLKTIVIDSTQHRLLRILAPVIHALTRSKTLRYITLDSFFVDLQGARAIEIFLSNNTTAKSFRLKNCRWHGNHGMWSEQEDTKYDTDDMGSVSQRIRPWISILRKNRSLQELTLNLSAFSPAECKTLFCELIKNPTIRKIKIEDIAFYFSRRGRRIYCPSAIQQTRSDTADKPDIIVAKCNQLHDLKLAIYEAEDCAWFKETILALTVSNYITKLSLDLRLIFQDGIISSVCAYITETSVLRKLHLWLPWIRLPHFQSASTDRRNIMRALERNSSVRKLTLENSDLDGDELAFLADIIRSSQVIHTFVLGSFPDSAETFLQHLSMNFSGNYTLVSLQFFTTRLRVTRSYFIVKDIVRRNHDLVTRAAQFVLGNRSRCCCEALESVHWNSALVEKLCNICSWEETKAAESVCASMKEIRGVVGYMRFAGVVENGLDFVENPCGGLWLDDIDEYSWLSVRQYLRVADVSQTQN